MRGAGTGWRYGRLRVTSFLTKVGTIVLRKRLKKGHICITSIPSNRFYIEEVPVLIIASYYLWCWHIRRCYPSRSQAKSNIRWFIVRENHCNMSDKFKRIGPSRRSAYTQFVYTYNILFAWTEKRILSKSNTLLLYYSTHNPMPAWFANLSVKSQDD
jgi:hypothetical protein